MADVARLAPDLGVEERLGDDRQGQAHHVVVDVARLAVAPGVAEPRGVLDHDRAVALDRLALEARLRELPLPPPEVALAGQQPLADDRHEQPREPVLDDPGGLRRRASSTSAGWFST